MKGFIGFIIFIFFNGVYAGSPPPSGEWFIHTETDPITDHTKQIAMINVKQYKNDLAYVLSAVPVENAVGGILGRLDIVLLNSTSNNIGNKERLRVRVDKNPFTERNAVFQNSYESGLSIVTVGFPLDCELVIELTKGNKALFDVGVYLEVPLRKSGKTLRKVASLCF